MGSIRIICLVGVSYKEHLLWDSARGGQEAVHGEGVPYIVTHHHSANVFSISVV